MIALEAHDQLGSHPGVSFPVAPALGDGVECIAERHALANGLLGVEHHLDIAHAFVPAPREEFDGDRVEVLRSPEHAATHVETVEEVGEVLPTRRSPLRLVFRHALGGVVGKVDSVAVGDRQLGRGSDRSLEVNVELDLGQQPNEVRIGEVWANVVGHEPTVATGCPRLRGRRPRHSGDACEWVC